MDPGKTRGGTSKARRDEHEFAGDSREPGRGSDRTTPHHQEFTGTVDGAAHGEDSAFDSHSHPPQHDRAG